jgi:hypothetical protein
VITSHATAAEMIRCTTLVPTPTVRPIFKMPMPSARSSRMRSSTAGLIGRRPSLLPFALARASPGVDTFADHAPFKFREHAAHLEHGAT